MSRGSDIAWKVAEPAPVLARLRCWWFGCEPDADDPAPPGQLDCRHCGRNVPYSDLVGDTRHHRFTQAARYWLFRKWIPGKCPYCRRRWRRCEQSVDHLPF